MCQPGMVLPCSSLPPGVLRQPGGVREPWGSLPTHPHGAAPGAGFLLSSLELFREMWPGEPWAAGSSWARETSQLCLFPGKILRSKHLCQLQWRRSGFRSHVPWQPKEADPSSEHEACQQARLLVNKPRSTTEWNCPVYWSACAKGTAKTGQSYLLFL